MGPVLSCQKYFGFRLACFLFALVCLVLFCLMSCFFSVYVRVGLFQFVLSCLICVFFFVHPYRISFRFVLLCFICVFLLHIRTIARLSFCLALCYYFVAIRQRTTKKKGLMAVSHSPEGNEDDDQQVATSSSSLPLRAGVSCLLKYWQCPAVGPVLRDQDGTRKRIAFSRMCRAILELRAPARWRLMRRRVFVWVWENGRMGR